MCTDTIAQADTACNNSILSFTNLNQVNFVKGHVRTLEEFSDGVHRSNAHNGGVHTCHTVTNQTSQWSEIVSTESFFTGYNNSSCSITYTLEEEEEEKRNDDTNLQGTGTGEGKRVEKGGGV